MAVSRARGVVHPAGLALLSALLLSALFPAGHTRAALLAQMTGGPIVALPQRHPAQAAATVVVPITFDPAGKQVGATAFSIDYDEACLAFDYADANHDGRPDSVVVHTPPGYFAWIFFNAADTDGEIDIALADLMPPVATLAAGTLVEISLRVVCAPQPPDTEREAAVLFSGDPSPSNGSLQGGYIAPGVVQHGSVLISAAPPPPTNTPTPVGTPSPTETQTETPIPTDTSVPTETSTPVETSTPIGPPNETATATGTPIPTETAAPTGTPTPTATVERSPGDPHRGYLSIMLRLRTAPLTPNP